MLTYNQIEDTRNCVESLIKNTMPDYELVFVDNGSTDETRQYLEQLKSSRKNIKLIFNDSNLGFAKANNQGMRIAEGDYILLLNNDVILTEGWLERLICCAENDPAVGVVGPCTNKAVGQQVVALNVEYEPRDIARAASLQLMKNAGNWSEVHRIIGFCMLIKRAVIEKAGMLDERFGPGGFEDYDFCLRVNQAGFKIMIANDVFIYHMGGRGYSGNNLDYDKLRQKNVQIFINKWCRKALEVLETL
jgi:GT2 family glycosyltransferase